MKTNKVGAILVLANLLAICSCSKDANAIDSKYDYHNTDLGTEEVSLNVYMDQGTSKGLSDLAEGFMEEYDNVTINVKYMGWKDLAAKVSDVNSVDPADGFMVSYRQKTWHSLYLDVWKEYCEDFKQTDIVDLSMFDASLLDSVTVDNKLFSLPLTTGSVGMMVNYDLLRECGVEELPNTTEEFLAACEKIKQAGKSPLRCKVSSLMYLIEGMTAMELAKENKVDDFTNAALNANHVSDYFSSTISLLNTFYTNDYIDWTGEIFNPELNSYAGGYCALNSESVTYQEECYSFLNGDVAFLPTYPDILSSLEKREARLNQFVEHPFEYGMMPIPTKYGPAPIRTASYSLFVCKNSQNKDWMNKFIQYCFYRKDKSEIGNVGIFSNAQFSMSPFDSNTLYSEISHKYYANYHKIFTNGNSIISDYAPLLKYNGYGIFRGCFAKALQATQLYTKFDTIEHGKVAIDEADYKWFKDGDGYVYES